MKRNDDSRIEGLSDEAPREDRNVARSQRLPGRAGCTFFILFVPTQCAIQLQLLRGHLDPANAADGGDRVLHEVVSPLGPRRRLGGGDGAGHGDGRLPKLLGDLLAAGGRVQPRRLRGALRADREPRRGRLNTGLLGVGRKGRGRDLRRGLPGPGGGDRGRKPNRGEGWLAKTSTRREHRRMRGSWTKIDRPPLERRSPVEPTDPSVRDRGSA